MKAILYQKKQVVNLESFNSKQKDILRVVFGKYAWLGAWDLSDLTHKSGTPWEETYSNKPNGLIDTDSIKEHFKKIITDFSFAILLSELPSDR